MFTETMDPVCRNNCLTIFIVIFVGTPVITFYVTYWNSEMREQELRIHTAPSFFAQSVPEKFQDEVVQKDQETHYRGHKDVDITVVTLYVNIGKFSKGAQDNKRDEKSYMKWMDTWAWLNNTVVAFFNDQKILDYFRELRSRQPADRTKIYLITKEELPAFRDLETVKRIYAQPGYPKHYPNTVNPLYSLTMYAKWDVIDRTLAAESVATKYIAWLDVGYFRNLIGNDDKTYKFKIEVPPKFDDSKVAYSQIIDTKSFFQNTSPWQIIKNNRVWVGGGYFVSTKPVMKKHIADFRSAVQDLLAKNMSSTDQQVIASLQTGQLKTKPSVVIQTNTCNHGNPWFCLGFKCKEAAEMRDLYCGR